MARPAWAKAQVGAGHPLKHRNLDLAAGAMQTKHPVGAMSTCLDGIHFSADETGRQVQAAHFCIHLEHDLHQWVIFGKNAPDAKLIGIEYIISRECFKALPEDEKRPWHSHHHEVKSGLLTAPGIRERAERAYMEDLVDTCGTTFHTWQYDRFDFPYGEPKLMMGFTADGLVDPALERAHDERTGVDKSKRREARAGFPVPDVVGGANAWESGRTPQTTVNDVDVQRGRRVGPSGASVADPAEERAGPLKSSGGPRRVK